MACVSLHHGVVKKVSIWSTEKGFDCFNESGDKACAGESVNGHFYNDRTCHPKNIAKSTFQNIVDGQLQSVPEGNIPDKHQTLFGNEKDGLASENANVVFNIGNVLYPVHITQIKALSQEINIWVRKIGKGRYAFINARFARYHIIGHPVNASKDRTHSFLVGRKGANHVSTSLMERKRGAR